MARINLTLKGVSTPEDLNRVTTALMMMDGVDTVDIGLEWAEIEGRVSRESLIKAVASLKAGYSAQ
ncbi:heavy-metal-associated domain-containing protein [Salinicola sp. V024]|uniref:heavy-metal-associated domain-containing protein n=1 Tax=Salinicola sp. V024 TaxID=3459609 RepID=UPI004044BFBA